MRHRDEIILHKVISEIDIAHEMLGTATLEEFINDEKLKRAVSMTVINIGEHTDFTVLKEQLEKLIQNNRQ